MIKTIDANSKFDLVYMKNMCIESIDQHAIKIFYLDQSN